MARKAYSLDTLLNQVNLLYPKRSKLSDGWIGDDDHKKVPSDHNPNSEGVVCALDLTHDPANGFDAHALADQLVSNRHPQLKYVISNGRIAGWWTKWAWTVYNGSNPHDKHIHVSVGAGDDGKSAPGTYDGTSEWNITLGGKTMEIRNRHQARLAYVLGQHREYDKVTDAEADGLIGMNIEQIVGIWLYGEKNPADAVEWHEKDFKMKNFDRITAENALLRSQRSATVTRDTALEYVNKNLK